MVNFFRRTNVTASQGAYHFQGIEILSFSFLYELLSIHSLLYIGILYKCRMREERRKANFERRPGRRGIRASEKPEDVDDIASWVNKSRQLDEKKKAEEREKAARMAKALEEQVGFDMTATV